MVALTSVLCDNNSVGRCIPSHPPLVIPTYIMANSCKSCGGPIVRGVDKDRTCPECRRLEEVWGDMGIGKGEAGDLQKEIGHGCYRKMPANMH